MSTAGALLAALRDRGVVVEAHANRLRLEPADRVTDADLAAMRRLKPELLTLLRHEQTADDSDEHGRLLATWRTLPLDDRRRLEAEADGGDPLARTVLERVACAPEACAWRLWSHRLGRALWIARDLAALRALEREALGGLPVVLAEDLERLRGIDTAHLAAVLDALATFPGARLADAVALAEAHTP